MDRNKTVCSEIISKSSDKDVVELKYSWSTAEADMIRGLKRHWRTPSRLDLSTEHVELLQTTARYYQPNVTITQLWDFPVSFWESLNISSSFYLKKAFLHEFMQCLNYLMTGKIIPANSKQHDMG